MSTKETQEYDRDAALANLTDEERAAIEGDELSPQEKAALEDIVGEDDDPEGEGDHEDDDGGEGDDDAGDEAGEGEVKKAGESKPAEAEVAASAAASASPPAADDADLEEVGSHYRVQLPDGFTDQVKALDEREADLARKFKAGDIESEEFIAENKSIASERSKLDRIATKAEIAQEMQEQTAAQAWQRKVRALVREAKADDGIDYSKPLLAAALDKALKDLAAQNEHKDKSMSWFLKEAHQQVKSELGIGKKDDVKPADKPAENSRARKPDVSKLPASLANVPGSDGPGDVGGEYADIDKLEGIAYEQALARMTPAQRERYLATA